MISLNKKSKVVFVASYPPRMCGIATFTSHLIENFTQAANGAFEPVVIAMESGSDYHYPPEVAFVVNRDIRSDYMQAADFINSADIDMVVLQHEFGLFGGPGGSYIVSMLRKINAPVITTLHTVLDKPSPEYYHSLIDVCHWSQKVIVMNKRGVDMLVDIYGISEKKIELIPHGIPDVPFDKSDTYKRKLNFDGRKVLMTFGLLGPNKGIEMALKAMPEIINQNPEVLYLIVGRTHPEIVKHDGYAYRDKLWSIVEELGLQNNVTFHDHFVTDQQLKEFLIAADIYITPYLNKEQLTSGTLAFAVGCGKAVISTPYWAAQELLDNNRGVLVPFCDPKILSQAVTSLLAQPQLLTSMQRSAYDYGRQMTWPSVGARYCRMIEQQLPKVFNIASRRSFKPAFASAKWKMPASMPQASRV